MKGNKLEGINSKKLHEISVIEQFISTVDPKVESVIEIGGGKGNLSYVLCSK